MNIHINKKMTNDDQYAHDDCMKTMILVTKDKYKMLELRKMMNMRTENAENGRQDVHADK